MFQIRINEIDALDNDNLRRNKKNKITSLWIYGHQVLYLYEFKKIFRNLQKGTWAIQLSNARQRTVNRRF